MVSRWLAGKRGNLFGWDALDHLTSKLQQLTTPYLLLLPSVIFMAVFRIYPIIKSMWYSFFEWNLSAPVPEWNGLGNFVQLIHDPVFWLVVRNNAKYTVGTVIPSVSLGLFLAIFANEKIRGLGLFRTGLFYPTIIPMAAASMIWLWIFDWLNSIRWALPALMVVAIWKNVGYYMVIFIAGLQNIDAELYEVATIEGAGPWHKFWRITFPLLTPTTFFVVIIAIISSFQSIDQVYMMTTRGNPANTTNLIVYYIYEHGFIYSDWGYGYTLSSVLLILLVILTIIYFGLLSRRVHY
jgi:ABC-type sugar transport system permease subunit